MAMQAFRQHLSASLLESCRLGVACRIRNLADLESGKLRLVGCDRVIERGVNGFHCSMKVLDSLSESTAKRITFGRCSRHIHHRGVYIAARK